jgi:hypothetical protein
VCKSHQRRLEHRTSFVEISVAPSHQANRSRNSGDSFGLGEESNSTEQRCLGTFEFFPSLVANSKEPHRCSSVTTGIDAPNCNHVRISSRTNGCDACRARLSRFGRNRSRPRESVLAIQRTVRGVNSTILQPAVLKTTMTRLVRLILFVGALFRLNGKLQHNGCRRLMKLKTEFDNRRERREGEKNLPTPTK